MAALRVSISRTIAIVFTVAAFALLLAACTREPKARVVSASVAEAMGAPADENYARAFQPRSLSFPLDHGPHPEYRTEWWYYTGNLTGAGGTPYGYQLTFFRNSLSPEMEKRASTLATNQVYMAHFALTDGNRNEHQSFDRYSRGAGELAGAAGEPRFGVWLEDWSAAEVAPGVMRLQAAASDPGGPVEIDLTLRETRPPVLHGEQGLHQKGPEPGNASYYYSLVGLETAGVITAAGTPIAVSGLSWMDHEFGTSALSDNAVGWDWFSVQLDDGTALMLYEVRTADGAVLPFVEGTLVWPNGRQEQLTEDDFTLTPTGEWTSSTTGITYPAGWEIALPRQEIALTVTPLVADQEMAVSFVYWEGAVDVAGTVRGTPARGRGYVELTGYGEQSRGYQR